MALDFTKFAFPGIEHPHAASLTNGIACARVGEGFVVITRTLGHTSAGVESTGGLPLLLAQHSPISSPRRMAIERGSAMARSI